MRPYKIPEDDQDFTRLHRTAYLIASFIEGRITAVEREELDRWIEASQENLLFFEESTDENRLIESINWFQQMDMEKANRRILEKMKDRKSRSWTKILLPGIAACVLLLAGIGIVMFLNQKQENNQAATRFTENSDVILTLADGREVNLDSLGEGIQGIGSISINKKERQVSLYDVPDSIYSEGINTLRVPRGKQYSLILADGSRIELNAESVLEFPIAFGSKERKVQLTGEGYFEIARKEDQPFIVSAKDVSITVLGTSFNVNAYPDENWMSTTLIEGSVKLLAGNQQSLLKPGEQAIYLDRRLHTLPNADIEKIIAWRHGEFIFREVPLDGILRTLGRWYDVEIVNHSHVNEKFSGSFSKSWTLEKIMNYLEQTKRVHYSLKGKTLTITDSSF